jgi:cytochrome d ubiquinol oxidase subunit II
LRPASEAAPALLVPKCDGVALVTEETIVLTLLVAIFGISILLYGLLDGVHLGVGILFGLSPDERSRRVMLSAVAPVSRGQETWLISAGVVLWGAFPVVYSTLISAFYVPSLLMFAGLIMRSVAFALRHKGAHIRWIVDVGLCCGSALAAFMQGVMVGALVEGLPMSGSRYVGDEFTWFSLFAMLCGLGLCFAYALLGACWLLKTYEGDVREHARWLVPHLAGGLLGFFVFLFFYVIVDLQVLLRWVEQPYFLALPATGIVAAFLLAVTVRHEPQLPFYMAIAIFAAAFGTLAISFWPYLIPFSVTIDQAAAPLSAAAFPFWTGALVLPLIVIFARRNNGGSCGAIGFILSKKPSRRGRKIEGKVHERLRDVGAS